MQCFGSTGFFFSLYILPDPRLRVLSAGYFVLSGLQDESVQVTISELL